MSNVDTVQVPHIDLCVEGTQSMAVCLGDLLSIRVDKWTEDGKPFGYVRFAMTQVEATRLMEFMAKWIKERAAYDAVLRAENERLLARLKEAHGQ